MDTVLLRKKSGGATITGPDGTKYSWPQDGAVTEVPYSLGMALLGIQDGDYSVSGEAAPPRGLTDVAPASVQSANSAGLEGSEEGAEDEAESREVTEPAPSDEHKVTEPAPKAAHKADEGSKAPESGAGSKITPRPAAGTRRTPASRRSTAAKK
jgi:hypothetical protein